ncbi:MAG TPA: ferritin-like domain-containing protein [Actinomycetota bacterium]|nr:ferritin-like domain-containing protein [Actinomycetota bacterium]
MSDDKMDVAKVIELVNKVLPLQLRSALQFTWTAATNTGLTTQAVASKIESFGLEDLEDARRLMEKVTTLGGTPTTNAIEFEPLTLTSGDIKRIVEMETETVDALKDVIRPTGQEGRSEAMEHLLEHIIMRKQNQIDYLIRASMD